MYIKSIIQLLRPEQWLKNMFIFLPAFFNGQLWKINMLLPCIITFFAFSFAASSVYCLNDILDVDSDRLHQKKCKRPVASGAISIKIAYAIMALCFSLFFITLFTLGGEMKYRLIALITIYYVMNIVYCIKLKHYAIIDVTIISTGFVLRILVGGVATGIWLSEWIIMMTFLLALFLAFAKRRDDVVMHQKTGTMLRKHTNRYNPEFLNQIISIVSTIIIIAYIMYTLSPEVTARFHSHYIYLTTVFVLIGIIRYLQITIVDLKSGSPTEILINDRFIQICLTGWIISFFVIIYMSK